MNAYPSRDWVNDFCEQDRIPDLDHERAVGISHIHASCSPPCPRVTAAREYLQLHGGERAEADGKRS